MAKELWCVRQVIQNDLSSEITVRKVDCPIQTKQYNRFAFIAEKGMYACGAIDGGETGPDIYEDYFYNLFYADEFAKGLGYDAEELYPGRGQLSIV